MHKSTRIYPQEYLLEIKKTLQKWTNNITNNKNFSFIKFGDGEFFCMMGKTGCNCDQHPYSQHLGEKLNAAWNFYCEDTTHEIYIAEWADQPGSFGTPQNIAPIKNPNNPVFSFYESLVKDKKINFQLVNFEILLQNTLTEEKFNFFKTLKQTNRKKIFVGPERLTPVQNFLNTSTHIQVPLHNTFAKYDEIVKACIDQYVENAIFIFSSGMPTKAIISDLLEQYTDITCLDTGSSFDAIFVGGTREGQLATEILVSFYKDLL